MKRFVIILFVLAFVGGCAGTLTTPEGKFDLKKARTALFNVKGGIITTATIANDYCAEGLLDQVECNKVADIYDKAGKTYDLAADSLIAIARNGTTEGSTFIQDFSALFRDMRRLGLEFGLYDDNPALKAQMEALDAEAARLDAIERSQ